MPESGKIDVAHVARLARLNLTEDEIKLFQGQLQRVLEYAEKLREPDTSQMEAAAHAAPIFDVLREDEPRPGFTAGEALSNAPRQANDLFVVPKVVE
jgi:aspartyl-tRNA(Asn)/glutamyl-tRNA(Gln) amidotransferase subunit C